MTNGQQRTIRKEIKNICKIRTWLKKKKTLTLQMSEKVI